MFRTSDMVLIAVMVAAAAFTYNTKHKAEDRLAQVRKLETEIRLEQDTIDLLKADWSLLTQPSRLQRLTEVYQAELKLQPVEASQIGRLSDIPQKPPEIEAPSGGGGGTLADNAKDHTVTGATVR